MAITFIYTESTNKVVQTEGTSGTPATFANFVTFDRAGTDTVLLSAGSPASDLALTYAVRPVEDLAILVKCVVANKTAEADFIFITGKDWRGAAQTESIDVTAGNGSYTSTKYWSEITTLDCSDNAAGGGTVWADGDLTVTQDVWGVIWDYGNGQYYVDCALWIGNGSTSTYFKINTGEFVKTSTDRMRVLGAAHLTIGDKVGDWGAGSAALDIGHAGSFNQGGEILIYSSLVRHNSTYTINSAAADNTYLNSIFDGKGSSEFMLQAYNTLHMKKCFLTNMDTKRLQLRGTPDTFEDVHVHNTQNGIFVHANDVTITKPLSTNASVCDYYSSGGANITIVDPEVSPTTVIIDSAGVWIKEAYPCNIHVADKDGVDLASALIDCEYANLVEGSDNKTYKCIADHTAVDADHKPITGTDWATYWELYSDTENFIKPSWETGFAYKSATQEFAQQTADANGDMTEQNVQYKKWVGTTEYEEQRLHKFTLSKAGYKTLVKENITVDGAIDWELELQPAYEMDIKGNLYKKINGNDNQILKLAV